MDTLFQVELPADRLEERLRKTEAYAVTSDQERLLNCANLSLYVLGLIRQGDAYLENCSTRTVGSQWTEVLDYVQEALKACGKSTSVAVPDPTPVETMESTLTLLKPGYGTCVFLSETKTRNAHAVVLYKTKTGDLVYLDPQLLIYSAIARKKVPVQKRGLPAILQYIKSTEKKTHWNYIQATAEGILTVDDLKTCQSDRIGLENLRVREFYTPEKVRRMILTKFETEPEDAFLETLDRARVWGFDKEALVADGTLLSKAILKGHTRSAQRFCALGSPILAAEKAIRDVPDVSRREQLLKELRSACRPAPPSVTGTDRLEKLRADLATKPSRDVVTVKGGTRRRRKRRRISRRNVTA